MSLAVTTAITPTNATDAQFRAWGSAIGVKLAAMGMIQTADTGQINWTTVLAPTIGSTVQGYEVWRFNDTLQATVPVFFKFEYGSGASPPNPSIHVSVGNGSNGSGSLNGVLSTRQQVTCGASGTPITANWSGDTNRLVFAFQGGSAAASLMISLERSVDTTGAVTSEAVFIALWGSSAPNQRAWNCVTGPYSNFEATFGAMGSAQAPFGTAGTQVAVYPIFFNKGVLMPYGLNLFGYVDATIGANATISFPVYGATHTFMPLGTATMGSVLARTTAATAMMIRYE
jgi:hypothetical protein